MTRREQFERAARSLEKARQDVLQCGLRNGLERRQYARIGVIIEELRAMVRDHATVAECMPLFTVVAAPVRGSEDRP